MFESFTPEHISREELTVEKPAAETYPEESNQRPPIEAAIDEEAVLRQIEERAAKYPQELSFRGLERTVDRALSDDPMAAYKKARFFLSTDSDLLFSRLTDLGTALDLLRTFKDRLPTRYEANIKKVLDHADAIRQIFQDYRQIREKGQGRDLSDVGALLSTLEVLRRIDPDRFPADLVDVTDEERERDQAQRNITLRGSDKGRT
jgi:hypothetical protein